MCDMTCDPCRLLVAELAVPGLTILQRLNLLGKLVDCATMHKSVDALQQAIELLDKLASEESSLIEQARMRYYLGNAWATLHDLNRGSSPQAWKWELPELEKTIVNLRLAIRDTIAANGRKFGLREMYTNLGNAYDVVGRFAEAQAIWGNALRLSTNFGMAIGNCASGLVSYSNHLFDNGQRVVMLTEAYSLIEKGLQEKLDEGPRDDFTKLQKGIKAMFGGDTPKSLHHDHEHALGNSADEVNYRRWCLDNILFLNPLNDLGAKSIASHDCLSCPPVVVNIQKGSLFQYQGFFSQLTQEYASARYLFYDGFMSKDIHYSDRHVSIIDTLDYPVYCLAVEKQKLAFRSAYSILDKVGFFLNSYLDLRIPETKVSFRSFWYNEQTRKDGLLDIFKSLDNLPLRGLFWLSKDLYESSFEFRESIEPDAKELASLRNHLEHKYMRVHDDMWTRTPGVELIDKFGDSLEHPLTRTEFSGKVLRMLQLARASLIYLSLGVHREERRRHPDQDANQSISIPITRFDDKWKR